MTEVRRVRGANIREARIGHAMLAEELGRMVGLPKETILGIESGRVEVAPAMLARIAEALGMSVSALDAPLAEEVSSGMVLNTEEGA